MYSLAGALALAALLAGPQPAQTASDSWESFAGHVKTGKKIAVTLMDMTHAEGRLLEIDARALTIDTDSARRTIRAGDVYSVRYAGERSRRAKLGALVGAAAGAAAMWAIDQQSDNPEPGSAVIMGALLIGAPGGAIAGASLPRGAPLYQAKRTAATAGTR